MKSGVPQRSEIGPYTANLPTNSDSTIARFADEYRFIGFGWWPSGSSDLTIDTFTDEYNYICCGWWSSGSSDSTIAIFSD